MSNVVSLIHYKSKVFHLYSSLLGVTYCKAAVRPNKRQKSKENSVLTFMQADGSPLCSKMLCAVMTDYMPSSLCRLSRSLVQLNAV